MPSMVPKPTTALETAAGKISFFCLYLYNACVGTVPILCRAKFRACLAYIMYVYVSNSVPYTCRAKFRPYLFVCVRVQFRAIYVPCPIPALLILCMCRAKFRPYLFIFVCRAKFRPFLFVLCAVPIPAINVLCSMF
jgi:hypothetical protein